ncbi:MAG TPA: phosphopantetheine-binding protein [Clostridia bacterium]
MENQHDRKYVFDLVAGSIASVLSVPAANLSEDTSLSADLVVDSLLMYEIVIELEELFDARISDSDIDQIETLGDIVDSLLAKKD